MSVASERPLRADAARNADRILRAAREVYAEVGPDAAVELIAERAGVGERTLYRRFPSKGELIRAALEQSIAENLAPAIGRALRRSDPLRGFTELVEAAISLGALEHNLLAVARKVGALAGISASLDEALLTLLRSAQEAGSVRADLEPEDVPRIIAMLNSVLWSMDPAGGGWRRYTALMLDAITTPQPQRLPPAPPLTWNTRESDWPL